MAGPNAERWALVPANQTKMLNNENIEYWTWRNVRVNIYKGDMGEREKDEMAGWRMGRG